MIDGHVGPNVSHLLLAGTPHFLHVMKVLLDRRAIGKGFDNRLGSRLGAGSRLGRVEMWRGGEGSSQLVVRPFRLPVPQCSRPCSVSTSPSSRPQQRHAKPGVRFSRTGLSDKASCFCTRKVASSAFEACEPQSLVQIAVGISCIPLTSYAVLLTQPSAEPLFGVILHTLICGRDRS